MALVNVLSCPVFVLAAPFCIGTVNRPDFVRGRGRLLLTRGGDLEVFLNDAALARIVSGNSLLRSDTEHGSKELTDPSQYPL